MGLFDWFTSTLSNVTVLDDIIWLTKEAKFKGLMQMVARNLDKDDRPHTIILVAHFRDCLEELQKISESVAGSFKHSLNIMAGLSVLLESMALTRVPARASVRCPLALTHAKPPRSW